MAEETALRRTPLYDRHVAAGARVVPFAGWEMPVQYEGIIPEHLAVRSAAGLFDVSHMGQLELRGEGATSSASGCCPTTSTGSVRGMRSTRCCSTSMDVPSTTSSFTDSATATCCWW